MTHGGPRPNAGRKMSGANKINDEARRAALETGISPLEFLLETMRDSTTDFRDRLDAAKAAAPYVHAKLSNVNVQGDFNVSLIQKEQRDASVAAFLLADK